MLRIMTWWCLGLCLLIAASGSTLRAQTINAAGCDPSSVQNALNSVNQASAAVVIPSGTCTWTTQVSYSIPANVTNLTIQGQTTVNCTGTPGTSSYACTPTDNTILVDAYSASNQPIWTINTGSASTVFRITGITFEGGNTNLGSNGGGKPNGFITVSGSSQNFRVDHCDFNTTTYDGGYGGGGMTFFSSVTGVVDHNTLELGSEDNGFRYYSGIGDYGDTSWSQPTNFGTSGFLFAEDDVFKGGAANDCDDGGRMVVRYSTIWANPNQGDTGLWQGHAMGQGQQRSRGCRALEVYHNYIYNSNSSNPQYSAGGGNVGTGLVWGNTVSGYSYDVVLEEIREIATGHTQTDAPNGIGYCGNASDGTASPWDGNSNLATGWPCIDQTGRGQGDLLNGQFFPNMLDTATGTITWPHNMLEPWYIWDETMTSGSIYNAPNWNGVARTPNLDFFVQNSSFNGTSGIGVGTLASRPATCAAGPGGTYGQSPTGSYGVGYWATDTSTLYVCTSANTWTAIYTPYTYPHPLDGGTAPPTGSSGPSSSAPAPPTGLSATVQ